MTAARTLFTFDDSYARDVPGMSLPWQAVEVATPELLVLNDALAAELGVDAAGLREPAGVALLVGNGLPDGVTTRALVYSGHQWGCTGPGWATAARCCSARSSTPAAGAGTCT
ncbi:hypothetical protein ACFQV8_11710 [Pseudonocardia benzenivorans]